MFSFISKYTTSTIMHFCAICNNMYYIHISSKNPNSLVYFCKNCGHQDDKTIDGASVLHTTMKHTVQGFSAFINKYTKMDPTLPRTSRILCPNENCPTHAHDTETTNPKTKSKVGGATSTPPSSSSSSIVSSSVDVSSASSVDVSSASSTTPHATDTDIIIIRYDDKNMKYIYLCPQCDYAWKGGDNTA